MKLDNKVYSEAQQLAREPHFKYILLGLACGAVVPTIYAKRYFLPNVQQSELNDQMQHLPKEESGASQMEQDNSRQPKPSMFDDEFTYELFSSII